MKLPRTAGFSLLEVLLSVLILGVGLVGVTEAITASLRAQRDAEVVTKAALLAAGKIEDLRTSVFLTAGEEEGEFDAVQPRAYRWRQTVEASTPDGLYAVTVSVRTADAVEPVYELRTLLFDVPLTTTETSTMDRDPSRRRGGPNGEAPNR